MALKDWKRDKTVDIRWKKYKYGGFWDWVQVTKRIGGYGFDTHSGKFKLFKTKLQALKYARKYMRTH